MVKYCCVPFCRAGLPPTKKFPIEVKRTLYSFPKDAQAYAAWAEAIPKINGLVLKQSNSTARVCIDHFVPENFQEDDTITIIDGVKYGGRRVPLLKSSSISSVWTGIQINQFKQF